jgi:ribosomal protein S27E
MQMKMDKLFNSHAVRCPACDGGQLSFDKKYMVFDCRGCGAEWQLHVTERDGGGIELWVHDLKVEFADSD